MLRVARAAIFAVLPGEVLILILLIAGVELPRAVTVCTEAVVLALLVFEAAVAAWLWRGHRQSGLSGRTAARAAYEDLVPLKVRRIVGFDFKGLVSLFLFAARRRHGVPDGTTPVSYHREQNAIMMMFMVAMVIEAVTVDLLLRAIDAPGPLRKIILAADVYGILIGLAIAAAAVTRPHVISQDELRLRSGGYFDLRIPRELIASVRRARNFSEPGWFVLEDEKFALAVSSQTNLVVELSEPVTLTRPLGAQAEVSMIRFFADKPEEAFAALAATLERS
jgi:hypothetical protein